MNKQLKLPVPPITYYPPPPEEPQWNKERQSEHTRSLCIYILRLAVWVEFCRSEMWFAIDMGLPVAPSEEWDSFHGQSEEYIGDLVRVLRVWASDPTELYEIDVDELAMILLSLANPIVSRHNGET